MKGGMNSGNAGTLSQPMKLGNASLRGWLGPGGEGGRTASRASTWARVEGPGNRAQGPFHG